MVPKFDNKMAGLYRQLINSEMLNRDQLKNIPKKGIYVFYKNDNPMYVGRSNSLRTRIQTHSRARAVSASAAFAFILTRDNYCIWKGPCWWEPALQMGPNKKATIEIGSLTKEVILTKEKLLKGEILQDFNLQKKRISKMQVRVVEVRDQYEQAMFEVYAAYALKTRYNDFSNH